MKSTRPNHRLLASAAAVTLACLAPAQGAAGEKARPVVEVLDAGSFRLQWSPVRNWQAKVHRESDGVIFQYLDKPAETNSATIGIFRVAVPPQARSASKVQLGAAYAIQDVAGVQVALFKSREKLAAVSKIPEAFSGGELLSYAEEYEVNWGRESSTSFIRAWMFFPRGFATSGAVYLVVGRERSAFLQAKPAELDLAKALIAGIQDPSSPGGP